MKIHASFGQPILNFNCDEIWAFWNEDRTFTNPIFKFSTATQLLGEDATFRSTEVIWSNGRWMAHGDCIQSDFNNSPFFYMNPLEGPQAKLAAIQLLLKDSAFRAHFSTQIDALEAYQTYQSRRAKLPIF